MDFAGAIVRRAEEERGAEEGFVYPGEEWQLVAAEEKQGRKSGR